MDHISKNISSYEERLCKADFSEQPLMAETQSKTTGLYGRYSTVYHGLTEMFNLGSVETLLIAEILSWSQGKEQCCTASQETLARATGVTATTVNTTLKELHNRGLIVKSTTKGFHGTNRIKVTPEMSSLVDEIKKYINGRRTENQTNKNKPL